MRIRKNRQTHVDEGDMTPMIDMTFQLIAFFMVLINFSEVEQNQEVNLPSSELAKPPDVPYEEPLTVQMLADGTILFGGDKMDSQGLGSALLTEAQIIRAHSEKKLSDVTVVIRADKEAKTGKVQEIIEKCQDAGFDTFALRSRQSNVSTLTTP
jgi:biopolymer transport protein ExbD